MGTKAARLNSYLVTHPYRTLALVAFAFMLPAFVLGPFGGDLLYHLIWSQEFSYELMQGNLYPRWLHRMNSGCGDPTFFLYYPLPYLITTLFSPLFFLKDGWITLACSITLCCWLMGITTYKWLSTYSLNSVSKLCAASLYMITPYSINIIYLWAGYSSYIPFVCLPLLLYFGRKIVHCERFSIIGYSLTIAALYCSSIPATIAYAWLAVCYTLWLGWEQKNLLLTFKKLLISVSLGTAFASLYIIPVFAYYNHSLGSSVAKSGYFDLASNMLFSRNNIIFSTLHIFITLYIIFMIYKVRLYFSTKQIFFWTGVLLIVNFLCTSLSLFFWDIVPIIKNVQFPTRFIIYTYPVILALFFAISLEHTHSKNAISSFVALMFCIVPLTIIGFACLGRYDITPESLDKNNTQIYTSQYLYQLRRIHLDGGIPNTVDKNWLTPANADNLAALCKRRTHVESGDAEVTVKEWRSRYITFEVNSTTASEITISQFMYPGWKAKDLENPAIVYPIKLSPEGAGLITISVPQGNHTVLLELETLPSERIGTWISGIALLILLGVFLHERKKIRTTSRKTYHAS